MLAHKGFHAQTFGRRGRNNRQVADAGHGHVQRTRNRCGGEGENIHFGAQRFDALFLLHAKAVFFVDDQQAQMLEFHIFLQQFVCADHDIGFPLQHTLQRLLGFFFRFEARQYIHFHRPLGKAVSKVLIMLLRQQGSGHQHCHLLAALHRQKRGAHGHFGFTETHIAAHQTVHRAW